MATTISDMLAGGALGQVVQWLLTGRDENDIKGYLRRDYPDAYGSSIHALYARAESSVAAGAELESAGPEGKLGIAGIPIDTGVKRRHGVDQGRITYRASVLVTDSDGNERYVTTFVVSESPLSAEEVRQAAAEDVLSEGFAERIFSRYRIVDQPPTVDVAIMSVVRSY